MIDCSSYGKIIISILKFERPFMYTLTWQKIEKVHNWHKKLLTSVSVQVMKN